MKALWFGVLEVLLWGCEHDPRFEHHREDKRPEPAVVHPDAPPPPVVNATVQRAPVFAPPPRPAKPRRQRHH